MPKREEQLENVPAAEVGETVQDYVDAGAEQVDCKKQRDGKWTITATFR